MYKDVKKKLLSVALCICMIIGMVQVVPKAKAADSRTMKATLSGAGARDIQVEYTWDTSRRYNGTEQTPALNRVVDVTSGASIVLNATRFKWVADEGESKNAGTYHAKLVDTENKYTFSGTESENMIEYTIQKATVRASDYELGTNMVVLQDSNEGVRPSISKVTLRTERSGPIELLPDDYEVKPFNTTGVIPCEITIKDHVKKNFSNQENDAAYNPTGQGCTVAYDLANNKQYYVAFKTDNGPAENGSGEYTTGSSFAPEMGIYSRADNSLLGEITNSDFQITCTKKGSSTGGSMISEAGEYDVSVKPWRGYATVNGIYFAGEATRPYTLSGKSESDLHVTVENPNGGGPLELHTGKIELKLSYNNGNPVRPRNILVKDSKGNEVKCEITYDRDTEVGTALMTVYPDASQYYGKKLEFQYYITSGLQFGTIKFDGYESDKLDLFYTGRVQLPAILQIYNVQGDEPLDGDIFYTVTYDYQDSNGQWQFEGRSEGGLSAEDAGKEPHATNMAMSGTKRIIVTGKVGTAYEGQQITKDYTISKIDFNGIYKDRFNLKVADGPFYYNREFQTPAVTMTYTNEHGDVISLGEDDIVLLYSNNRDVTTEATVTVQATASSNFSGERTATFQILPLDLAEAVVNPAAYTYNRSPIQPTIQILGGKYGASFNCELTKDIDYVVVNADGTPYTGTMPSDCGTYDMWIQAKSGNGNIINSKGVPRSLKYKIDPANLANIGFTLVGVTDGKIEWWGKDTKPPIESALTPDVDYTVTYQNCEQVGTGSAIIMAVTPGNYTGTKTLSYGITPRSLSRDEINASADWEPNGDNTFKVILNVTDTVDDKTTRDLSKDTDYVITKIEYLTDPKKYTPTVAEINALTMAGEYRITLEGTGANYQGTTTVTVKCGTDISNYWVHIDDKITEFPYTGSDQTPKSFSLRDGNNPVTGIIYNDRDFTVKYERDDDVSDITTSVGKIYVTAIGNPERGYYGKTTRTDRDYGFYTIVPPVWTETNLEVFVEDIDYRPENAIKPIPVVTFSGISLYPKEDYTLTYVPNWDQAGEHSITVTGVGNYAGQKWTCYYNVRRVDITDEKKVHRTVTEANYNDISKGTITLKQGDYVLQEGDQDDEKDYIKSKILINGQEVAKDPNNPADSNYYVTYEITGYGNYTGTFEQKVLVRTYDFSDPKLWASSKDTAKPGQFYIEWFEDELVIEHPETPETGRDPVKPDDFQVMYKRSETGDDFVDIYPLDASDYKIIGYGANQKAGKEQTNFVVIEGQGGYSGTHKEFLTLYTLIDNAQPTQESFIKEGAVIKRSQWKKIYDQYKEKGLLELEGLSFGESVIDSEEYELRWPAGFNVADPGAGTYTVTVNGLHKPKYYYHGKVSFTFEIRDDIEGAEIVVGNDNTMMYKGKNQAIELTANDIRVTVDGDRLILGTDYEIVKYDNNIEIGEATVHLKGIGKYGGEVDHTFKITYPINRLIVFVRDPNGDWQDTRKGPVEYSYNGSPIEPDVNLYCPADFDIVSGSGIDPYVDIPLSINLYNKEYSNNTDAGDATITIKSSYLTEGSAPGRRSETFKIGAGMIAPPKVTYTSSKGYNLKNLRVPYMGELYEVDDDLGIELADGSLTLKEGEHYKVWFEGDRKNATDPKIGPTKIHFDGLNNYAGSTYAIDMTIEERPVTDQVVEAPQVLFTYTDNVREQNLLDAMKLTLTTPRNRKQPLVYGTDYTIEGYYMDAGFVNEVPLDKGVYENGRMIPKAPGSYYAKVVGKGNFTEERAVSIEIEKRNLTDNIRIEFVTSQDSECIVVNGVPDCTYNGKEHHPAIQVTYGIDAIRLVEGRDYEVSYGTNVDAGEETASVTVTMIDSSNYEGEATRTFTIKQKDIAGEDMDYLDRNGDAFKDEAEYEWTKQQVRPTNFGKVRDTSRREDLTEGKDYTIDYQDHNNDDNQQINAGEVEMIFSGSGNYTGEKVFTYYIGEDISRAYTLVNGKRNLSVEYNGLVQAPKASEISVEVSGSENLDLITPEGEKRYAIQYFKDGFKYENRVNAEDFVNAGTYYVAVVGVPELGTYAKSSEQNTCTYKINPRSISPSYVLVSGYDATYYYTGQAVEPKGITVEDTDLPVAGEETSGRKRTVKLIPGIDYDLSYANNTGAGKASIIVAGKGNYAGNRVAYFNILSSNADGNNTWDGSSEGSGSISNGTTTIAASDIILGYDNSDYNCMMYNGYERIPTVTINGINTNEFIITASNNIYPGVATLAITGRGNNFTGTIYKNYRIKANLAVYGNISAIEDQVYSGYQITPHVTVTCGGNLLNPGRDYTLTYRNNTNVGRATVTATATNDSNYIGSVNGGFNISNTAGGMEITGYASSYTYTGYAVAPDVVVTMNGRVLNRGTDYTVTYSNNTNVGTATMTVTGIGSFSGTKTINYTIEAKNIENCLTTAVDNYQYTGSTYTPNVSVTDSSTGKTLIAGTDYMITYSNNTNPGTASITITALSKNYTGSKVIPFKITSASVSGLRTSAIKNNSLKLAWSAQDYADGYQICNSSNRVVATTRNNSYTVKGLTSCTTYRFKVRSYVENADGSISYGGFSTAVTAKTLLNTPKLKAASTRRGTVTLTWSKVAKATGYEIYYSTKKNGVYTRLKTVSKSSSRRYVDRGLASGERYYYTIRAYRTTNGVKTYSSYNTIKSVKVK